MRILHAIVDWCWCTWVTASFRREDEWRHKESMARIRWAKACQDMRDYERPR